MRPRQQKVLKRLLLHESNPLLVESLAQEFECSEKTIRNDLRMIEQYLTKKVSGTLMRKPGVGVYLDIIHEDKQLLLDEIYNASLEKHGEKHLSNKELMEMVYHLLIRLEPATLKALASQFYTSVQVIRQALQSLETWFSSKNLQIQSKQRVGIYIKGDEKSKRLALATLDEISEQKQGTVPFILTKMPSHERSLVNQQVDQLLKKHKIFITDQSIGQLKAYVLLMFHRTKKEQFIRVESSHKSYIQEKVEYQWIHEMSQKLSERFVVSLPEDELIFLTIQLLGAKFSEQLSEGYPFDVETERQASQITDQLTKRLSIMSLMPLNQDEELKDGLKTHIYSVLNRLKYHLQVKNPLLQDIKKMYPNMFDLLISVLDDMKSILPYDIPEDEVAFLTLHYQAAVERLQGKEKQELQVAVVCHMGIGVSEILRSKLTASFQELSVKASLSQNDLGTFLKDHHVDLVVTTVDLEQKMVPQIIVSPLFTEEDQRKLENYLVQKEKGHGNAHSVLAKYLSEEYIYVHMKTDHRFKLIEQLSNHLARQGIVKENYGHEALIRERRSATAIGGRIAIPHGNPDLVKESKIVVVTLPEPMQWGTEQVSLIFFLALKHELSNDRRKLFHRISKLAGNPTEVESIVMEKDKEKIIELL
ncbi:BglG family transcription antiterminator [Gracilibacillus sp. YIM 98692]|uniref:BglG family transcription antiterminator n=1 Tax=Gracilibacillus sp. YIM 98692 TaxID=2663532 RepID=UPI0013D023DF|nr:BglG family transcription antiterminator [Gracilibacillus sp. YIM 98692]